MISDPATIVYFYIFYSPVVQFSLNHYSAGVRWKVKGSNTIVIQDCSENTYTKSKIPQKMTVDSMRMVNVTEPAKSLMIHFEIRFCSVEFPVNGPTTYPYHKATIHCKISYLGVCQSRSRPTWVCSVAEVLCHSPVLLVAIGAKYSALFHVLCHRH